MPEVEIPIPAANENDDDETEPKRRRVGSEQARTEPYSDEDFDEQPELKRPRVGTGLVGVVSWVDEMDEEDAELGEERDYRRCRQCHLLFWSRNSLFKHLREVHQHGTQQDLSGSVVVGRTCTEEAARGALSVDEPKGEPHAETCVRSGGRTGRKSVEYDVCEIFSVPRVTKRAWKHRLRGGWSLDVKNMCPVSQKKWDCRVAADRDWALRRLRRDRPAVVVVSPPCTLFSQLQHLSPYGLPEVRCPDRWREAVLMLEVALEVCELQRQAGRGFVLEHPQSACS